MRAWTERPRAGAGGSWRSWRAVEDASGSGERGRGTLGWRGVPRGRESRETDKDPGIGKGLALRARWHLHTDLPTLKLESPGWK